MGIKVSVSRATSKNAGKKYTYLVGQARKDGYCKGGRFNTPELDQARVTFNGAKNRNKDITPESQNVEEIFELYYEAHLKSLETGVKHRIAMVKPKNQGGLWTLSNMRILRQGQSLKPKKGKEVQLDLFGSTEKEDK